MVLSKESAITVGKNQLHAVLSFETTKWPELKFTKTLTQQLDVSSHEDGKNMEM